MAPSRSPYKPFPASSSSAPCVGCTSTTADSSSLACGVGEATGSPALGCHAPPPDQLTAQCTDQCVVIACSNPEHPESICPRTGPHTQCDFVCDEAVDCVDCHGFDAFLQCCDDYHPYSSATPPATTSSAWETAFAEWCAACAEPPPATTTSSSRGLDKAIDDSGSGHPAPSSPKNTLPSQLHHQPPMQGFMPAEETYAPRALTPAAPPSPLSAYSCMWAACNATFSSLSELVGHVNLDHLTHSSSSSPSSSLGAQTPAGSNFHSDANSIDRNISAIACLWGNCGSSYYSSSDNSFQLLANHLLNEHLGADPLVPLPQQHQQQNQHQNHPQTPHQHHHQPQHPHYQQSQNQPHHQPQHQHPQHEHQPSHHHHHPQQHSQNLSNHSIHAYGGQAQHPQTQVHHLAAPSAHPDPIPHPTSFPTPPALDHHHALHTRSSGGGGEHPLSQIATPNLDPSCAAGAPHTHECRWKACGAVFHSCDALTTHIGEVHIGAGKARYECFWEECTRNGAQGFQSKQKISRHVQSHTGHRPFQCSICHQNFSEAATLQQHTRRHTQEKPYVCDYPGCGKSFAITGALTIHKRTHNGDKPFKCTYCERGFAESSNLSKHLRTHTGARPYICAEAGCGKAFARPDQLNRHKSVHKKQTRGIGGRATIEA